MEMEKEQSMRFLYLVMFEACVYYSSKKDLINVLFVIKIIDFSVVIFRNFTFSCPTF